MKILYALFFIVLSGCATKNELVVKEKVSVLTPPPNLISDCKVSPPFKKEDYLNGKFSDKEKLLSDYSISLLTDLGTCNVQMSSLRKWLDEQKTIFETESKK